MPIIRNARSASSGHTPSDEWGEDTLVQWGGSGIVLSKDGPPRSTAFFEAFPQDPAVSDFIRGEGDTVEAAEKSALNKMRRQRACAGHLYGRRGYTNGLGVCTRCGATRSSAFRPIKPLGEFRRPPSLMLISGLLEEGEEETRNLWEFCERRGEDPERFSGVSREDVLRLCAAGVPVPHRAEGQSALEHRIACGAAVRERFSSMSLADLKLDTAEQSAIGGMLEGAARSVILDFVREHGRP